MRKYHHNGDIVSNTFSPKSAFLLHEAKDWGIRDQARLAGTDGALARARQIGAKGRKAATIALAAGDNLFTSFLNEQIRPEQAEVIAASAPNNDAAQALGIRQARKGLAGPELGNFLKAVQVETGGRADQLDMFGHDDAAIQQMEALAKRAGQQQKAIREQIAAVQGVAKRPEQAAKLGVNVADPDGVRRRVAELKAELDRWENWPLHPDLVDVVRGKAPAPKPEELGRPAQAANRELNALKAASGKRPLTAVEVQRLIELQRQLGQQDLNLGAEPTKSVAEIEAAKAKAEQAAGIAEGQAQRLTAGELTSQPDLLDAGQDENPLFTQRPPHPPGEPGETETMLEQATLPRRVEGATPAPAGETVSLAGIRQYLSQALDIPVRFRRFTQSALGIFKAKAETIRLRALNDLPTLAHEVGHYLHYLLFPDPLAHPQTPSASDFAGRFDGELLPLGQRTAKPKATVDKVRHEGVAEFFREWLTDRAQALAKAPQFTTYFEGELQSRYPEVWRIVSQARADVARYIQQPAMAKVRSRINRDPTKASFSFREFVRKGIDNWVDELAPMKRALQQLRAFGLPEQQARLSADLAVNYIGGWRGKVEHSLYERQIDLEGNDVGPSLREVLAGIGDFDEFGDYLVARRELELHGRGIRTGLDPQDVVEQRAAVAALDAKYARQARALDRWQRNDLHLLVEAGILTQERFQRMVDLNRNYVPFHRVFENLTGAGGGVRVGQGFINLGQGVYRIRGSDRQYVDPLESIVKNAYTFRDLAERNRVAATFLDAVDAVRGGGRVGESVAVKIKPIDVSGEEVAQRLKAVGIDVPDNVDVADLAFKIYRLARQQSAPEGIFTVWREGKEQPYQVGDLHLYRALALADRDIVKMASWLPGMRLLRAATRAFRAGATLTIEFIGRNPFRDQVTAGVFSKFGFVPFVDGFRGTLAALGKDRLYWDWVKSGGRYSDFVATDRGDLQAKLRDVVKDPSALRFALSLANPLNVIKNLQKFSELMEMASRIGEFRRAKASGASDLEAANAAKDVTLNFARAGFHGKLVNQLVAFYNAGIQDLSKFARAHQERPVATTLKALFYISVPSILAWYLGKDDKEIQRLPEWRKNFFWNVNLRSIAQLAGLQGTDFVLSFPKPFLLGQVYGSSFERALDYVHQKDPNAVQKWFASLLQATPFSLDAMMPSVLRPVVEDWANRSFWRNQPLENQGMERLPVNMRYGPQTSLTARLVSDMIPWDAVRISPIKFDNLVRGWFAGLGRYGTDATDYLLARTAVMNVPDQPAKTIWERPFFRGFARSPYESSAWVERFYSGLQAAEQRVAGLKQELTTLDTSGARRFFDGNKQDLAFYLMPLRGTTFITELRRAQNGLGDVAKAMQTVQNSRDLTPQAKRENLIKLGQMRDTLAEISFKTFLSPGDQRRAY